MINKKRTAREIKLLPEQISCNNINIKVGAVENKEAPETVYIFTSFWIEPVDKLKGKDQSELKRILDKELEDIYQNNLRRTLKSSGLFPIERNNIFIKNIPDNFNYNNSRNYISVELYLHTKNLLDKENKLPLCHKKDDRLFKECVRISDLISKANIFQGSRNFIIHKSST